MCLYGGKRQQLPMIQKQIWMKRKQILYGTSQGTLRHVYRKILRKQENEARRKVIKNMSKDHEKETALSYSRMWAESLDNDTIFFLFKRLEMIVKWSEMIVKSRLPQTTPNLRNKDICEGISVAVLLDDNILSKWTQLTVPTSISKHSLLILLQLLWTFMSKYIN